MIDPSTIQRLQKDLQVKMEKAKAGLRDQQVEGTSGGGAVKVVANGQSEILSIKISPDAVDPDDIEMLEDLVMAAINQALEGAQELYENTMSQAAGGVKLPGLF